MTATVTVAEAADLLGQGQATIYDQVRRGHIPNVGIGAAVRIPRAWIEARFADAGAPLDISAAERIAEHQGLQTTNP